MRGVAERTRSRSDRVEPRKRCWALARVVLKRLRRRVEPKSPGAASQIMLGGMNIQPEQHRYPFLASLLCIPSQDAIIENEGAAGPEDDDGKRMREARGLVCMSDDAIAATVALCPTSRRPPDGRRRRDGVRVRHHDAIAATACRYDATS